jgi:glycosyltransferase involved in cell wall biosynthesis
MRSFALCAISLHQMAGGLEKNFVLLANHLAQRGDSVHLLTFDQPGASPFYALDPRVQWHKVARTPPHSPISFGQRLQVIGRMRRALRDAGRPVLVCFHHGVLPRIAAAAAGLGLPLVCSERNSLMLYDHVRKAKWSAGFVMLGLARRITVQFPSYVADYPWWLRSRIRVVPNPVFPAAQQACPDRPGPDGRLRLLNVGRLCTQKNQRLLIDAFAAVCARHPQWDLHIVGDGEIGAQLAAHVQARGLSGRVLLQGKQRDVPTWLASAHLYCMPSQWEGFPNALGEAMAHGLPSIGLRSCAGVRDLIVEGVTGRLTDVDGLAQALDALMTDAPARALMGRAARQHADGYRPEETFRRWDAVLDEATGQA